MAGFLYFLEGDKAPPLSELVDAGLGHAFDSNLAHCGVRTGPGGKPGTVLSPQAFDDRPLGYYPDVQAWRKCPTAPWWLGYYRDGRPTPRDLVRGGYIAAGRTLTLGDGNVWMVPIARALAEEGGTLSWYNKLPALSELDDAGRWVRGAVLPRYAALWEAANGWFDLRVGVPADDANRQIIDDQRIHEWAVTALAANYRLGSLECAELHLFSDDTVAAILDVIADWATLSEWAKKKAAAAGAST